MRTLILTFFAAAFTAGAGTSPLACDPFDRGGLTFDFKAISERRFSVAGAKQLSPADWKGGYCYMHNRDIAGDDPRRKAVKAAVEYTCDGGEWTILKKPELVALSGGEKIAANVSGGMSQTVKLANADGGVYHVAATYRMRHDVGTFGGILITPIAAKEGVPKGKSAPGDMSKLLSVNPFVDIWGDWLAWAKDIRVPKGCDALNLVMRIDGVGELVFRDVSVTRVPVENEITLVASPGDFLDRTFAFSEGQCALPSWMWKKNDPEAKYAADRFTFVLTLPKGYRFIESTAGLVGKETSKTLPEGSTEYRIPSNASYAGCHVTSEYSGWPILAALVRAEAGAGSGEMRFFAEYEGKRVTDVAVTTVFTIPALKAKVPARYANGFYPGGPYAQFKTKEGREGFAEMFTAAGANWVVQMLPDAETRNVWREKGVRYITPSVQCANGFEIGNGRNAPASDKYVALPRATHRCISNAVCPISVYAESDYFRTNTLPAWKKALVGCDGIWANWEPYMFEGNGCMCDKCRAAFAKYVGVTDAEMAKDWPQELAFGHKWYAKSRRFRSLEHAKLIRTVDKYVTAFTGGKDSLGFIPGIAWTEMSSGWRPLNLAAEVQAIDYAGSLKWIDPWGPYPCWDASVPYSAPDGFLLSYFVTAKDVRAQVDRDYGRNAPKLMSFPHGVQCLTWFTQPESIAISFDSFFFNGWESSIAYAFPKGCDARYWQAFAEATTRAAEFEDYVFDGRRCDDEVKVSLDPSKPYPPARDKVYSQYLKYATNVPLLQHVAYELNGKTIVAVFNFADKDVAYATIAVPGKGSRKVTVGATRCRVFTFDKTEEVVGRTWDRLSEAGLADDAADARVLTAAEVAAVGGRQIPLCMIGDSITWAEMGDCWRKWLLHNVPTVAFVGTHTARFGYSHAGEGGNSTPGVLARVDNPERVLDCPYYHLMIGANDSSAAKCAADVPRVASNTVERIWRIVDRLLAKPATRKVFLASILPMRCDNRPFRDAAGSAANALMRVQVAGRYPADRVVWVEYERPLRDEIDAWLGKGNFLHPREPGYKMIARMFKPYLAALVPDFKAADSSPSRAYGVEVVNLWDETASATRPLIPGWYVLSFAAPKAGVYTVRLRNKTENPKGVFDRSFTVKVAAGARGEFEFMTGYQGYGYAESPFVIDVSDAAGAAVGVTDVQVEKMRPTRKASRYGRGVFVDATSPICAGELLVR